MNNYLVIILTISSAVLSGLGVAIVTSFSDAKKDRIRREEKEKDELKLELKDLQIKLYQLEKDLIEWKDRYYETIQELVSVRAELEETLIRLSLIHIQSEIDG
jgi:peptidoglycan hydrolase CwlO-like protein